ncbi:MAG: thiol:disulfide interchange protein DsbG [Betaproteobacteria bacterium]|nr:thiol:disulfide interchange protein DsbG [Betaproteobacteria bacterium]
MRFRQIIAALCCLLAAAAAPAFAEEYPRAIRGAIDQGMKLEKRFPAASGLTGWVLADKGEYIIVFTTPDRKTLVSGALYDEAGRNLMADYRNAHVPRPELEGLFKELETAPYVPEGPLAGPGNLLYVIYDPNCPYCHLAWKMLQPYETAGLQVRWVPVAFLAPSSMPKAIETLAAPDQTRALRRIMQKFGQSYTPPAQYDAKAKPEIAEKIGKNLELMRKFGLNGTPGIIWKDRNGKILVKGGLPRLSELPAMTGLPEQKVDDPELAKYR